MNYGMILYILGMASGFEALFLLLPVLVSVIYGEDVLSSYLISCVICAVFCGISTIRKPKKITMYTKEGLVAVALVWIWFSAFGAVHPERSFHHSYAKSTNRHAAQR